MKKFIFSITGTLIINLTMANLSWGNSSSTYTHTPTELKPISLENSYQIAAICFLGNNCNNEIGYDKSGDDLGVDNAELCKKEGFKTTSCELPTYLNGQCPYDNTYYARCSTDNAKACEENGYVNQCETGEQLKEKERCQWDSSYGKCCQTCTGYDYTKDTIPEGYIADGNACNSCNGEKFRIKINPCDGFKECDLGGAVGAKTCMSGTLKKFNSCKGCPSNCFGDCPQGADCFKCDGKFCISQCKTGFWSYENYFCKNALMCLLPKPHN